MADVHRAVLFEVGPGRVDDGDVVFLVAWWDGVSVSWTRLPFETVVTFYRVGLGELGQVDEEVLWDVFP